MSALRSQQQSDSAPHSLQTFLLFWPTARELDVLRGVAKGSSNKIIASDLNISERTVKNHLKSILSKLDASDRTRAVMIALKRGILDR